MNAWVDFRDAAGLLLGQAKFDGRLWQVRTVDGRATTVDTRSDALLGGSAMADAVEAGQPGEEPPVLGQLRVLLAGWRATAGDIDPGSAPALNVLRDPGAMRAETLRRCAAEIEMVVEAAPEGGVS